MWFHSSGLDHCTRGLCSILLRGRMCLPSELLHECHQSCYCANSGKSQIAPDDKHFHYHPHFLWGLIYACYNHRCTLSTRRRCPSPAVPLHSSTASLYFTLTTAPMSSSRSTATWWSEPAAVTDCSSPSCHCRKSGGMLEKGWSRGTRDKTIDCLATRELLSQTEL